jgi:hypothetical protein
MKVLTSALRHQGSITLRLLLLLAFLGFTFVGGTNVSANHPVLVEGNCDSPVPGTTLVSPGTCGDFDGDGRIGTAEDTDGADRIFGTIAAALGPGTGAAAGTGANQNGTVTIVTSGRFAEILAITPGTATFNHGNVILQAAPGVEAQIDAVFQGDPAGGNNTRQAAVGITVNGSSASTVILRNLSIRNWTEGVQVQDSSRLTIDNCRIENNVNFGVRALGASQVAIHNSNVNATGYRSGTLGLCPSGACIPNPGHAISFEGASAGTVTQTLVSNNFNRAISNTGTGVVTYRGVFIHNNGSVPAIVGATRVDF